MVPKVFRRIEIRTFSRMSCNIDVILSEGIHCRSSGVRFCIVMHEKHVSMLLHEWSDMRKNDLIHITDRSNAFSKVAVIEIEEDRSQHDIMGHSTQTMQCTPPQRSLSLMNRSSWRPPMCLHIRILPLSGSAQTRTSSVKSTLRKSTLVHACLCWAQVSLKRRW